MLHLIACASFELQDPTPLAAVPYSERGADDEIVLLVLGDSGKKGIAQHQVGAHAAVTCERLGCDLSVLLGDNIYETGAESSLSRRFVRLYERPFEPLGSLETWVVMGNHDWLRSAQAQIDYTKRSERWRMPDLHYRVPGLPEWFTLYGWDSELLRRWTDSAGSTLMLQEMEKELCADEGWKLAFGHHPLRSSGLHGLHPTELIPLQDTVEPIFERCGVDVALAGHDHHLELLEAGSYTQVVAGSASKSRPLCTDKGAIEGYCAKVGTDGQEFISSSNGYAVVVATASAMRVEFYALGQEEAVYRYDVSP